jgi:hypothetical protein
MSRRDIKPWDERGTRLVSTMCAYQQLGWSENKRGTLLGFSSKYPECIRVVVDGTKTPVVFHVKFWRRAQTSAEKSMLPANDREMT